MTLVPGAAAAATPAAEVTPTPAAAPAATTDWTSSLLTIKKDMYLIKGLKILLWF